MLSTWLNYWHNALVDIDRQDLQAKDEKSLSLPSLAKEPLALVARPLCQFYEKCATPRAGTSAGQRARKPLDVLVAPFELRLRSSGNYVSAKRLHNKPICIDDDVLIEGCFNWLSASRSEVQARHEVSWSFRGEACSALIEDLPQKTGTRLLSKGSVGVR